jgi:flagellar secretion chaperone FliS
MNAQRYYREATVAGASPIALVVRLYEKIIEDLREAIKALEQNKIELRTAKINHAILIIGCLDSKLNFAEGGKVAEQLRTFYSALRANLLQAQLKQSKEVLARVITDLLAVREAWLVVERSESAPAGVELHSGAPPIPQPGAPRLEWNG